MKRRPDLVIVLVVLLLTAFGLTVIYSTGGPHFFFRQLLFLPAAFAGFLIAYFTPRRVLQSLAEPAYLVSLLLLVLVLFFGTGPGSRRWFLLGPLAFQPSEFAKLATVLLLAKSLSGSRTMELNLKSVAPPLLICLLPAVLVLAEPDLSTALVLAAVLAVVLYWNGLSALNLLLLCTPFLSFIAGFSLYIWIPFFLVLAVIVFTKDTLGRGLLTLGTSILFGLLSPLSLRLLKRYQADRIKNFLAPWLDPHGVGWNAIQSRIAIGSGRLFGKGYLRGTQNRLGFLPNRHTDFVFSCVGEEFGFIGSVLLLAGFALLIHRFLLVGHRARDRFDSLLCAGCAAILLYQVFVNVGMLLGLLPITGVVLPFISYSGSSLLVNYMMAGLVANVATRPE